MTFAPQDIRQLTTSGGETLGGLAQRYLGDVSRFRDIADINDLSVFEDILGDQNLDIPLKQAFSRAQPAFTKLSETLNAAQGKAAEYLSSAQDIASQVGIEIPEGYTKAAMDALGEVNGVLGEVESIFDKGLTNGVPYGGRARVVDWLLR